jgi:hypothetical protein
VRNWKLRLGMALLIIAAAVIFAVRVKGLMHDFNVYYTAAGRVWAGETLYRAEDGHWQYKYLPTFAFVLAPLSKLPVVPARAVWYALVLGAIVLFVKKSYDLLPDKRRAAGFVVGLGVLAMAKFYIREMGLGQSNVLLALLVMLALEAGRSGREALVGVLLAGATVVKPYAILFWPYLVARKRFRAAAWFAVAVLVAVLLPAIRYGFMGNVELIKGLWTVVTTSTAPNLLGRDNASIAGMFAGWFGVSSLTSHLALLFAIGLLAVCVWILRRRGPGSLPEYLEFAVLLYLIPLLSPQGWDYVFLMGTPGIMLLLDRMDTLPVAAQRFLWVCLAIVAFASWDLMGRHLYGAFMGMRIVSVCALIELALILRLRVRQLA